MSKNKWTAHKIIMGWFQEESYLNTYSPWRTGRQTKLRTTNQKNHKGEFSRVDEIQKPPKFHSKYT